ncbi:DinB family protein [bacterium]|nr:DinB family protein [bacterium]
MAKRWRHPTTPPGYDSLIASVEMSFMCGAWHGKNLNSAFKGVDAGTAHQAVPGRSKTIWQICLHCAYWCYRVRVKLSGTGQGSFPRKGSDWLEQPAEATETQWKADRELLRKEYTDLLDTLAGMRDGEIQPAVPDDELEYLVTGAAFHAIYHASQVAQFRLLLRKQ